jgi:hypothetical protein
LFVTLNVKVFQTLALLIQGIYICPMKDTKTKWLMIRCTEAEKKKWNAKYKNVSEKVRQILNQK